ncbi:MAG: primosomal protein DnaI [Turicibacter sp.]|nr:primosomal protein DnaI [Turicibacter sp.]
MKKLGDLISEISDVDDSYGELLSNPKVSEVLKRHEKELDMRLLPSFMTSLDEYAHGSNMCEGCQRLAACKQPIKGHFPTLTPHVGRLNLAYAPCEFYKSGLHLNQIQNFHVPKSMLTASLSTLEATENREELFHLVVDFISHYSADNYKKGLFIHGSYGTGKTYTLCVIANELAKKGFGCAIVYLPELIAELKSNFGNNEVSNNAIIEKIKQVPVLMLDDISGVTITGWMRDEVLGRILNHRMMHELPTFFSSNSNYDELLATFSETNRVGLEPVKATRVMERIKALSVPVELVGKNYRN